MHVAPSSSDEQLRRARRCLEGDGDALAELRAQCHGPLLGILRTRGASATEAEDILADLWSDCVPRPGEQPSLLEKFSGRTPLLSWLATVATNRWLDLKRRQARSVPTWSDGSEALENAAGLAENPPGACDREETLVRLVGESLRAAFRQCSAQALVLLQLVYVYELSQREVGRMLGWSESKISRFLGAALAQLETDTLRELRRRDRWLELSWEDLVELCETHQIGFL